jgi:hypothetical protein
MSVEVERNVRSRFVGKGTDQALATLSEMTVPSQEPAWVETRKRVQIALLMLADSDIGRLKAEAAKSQIDWRDTLVAAGLSNEDWKEVAREAGYNV